MFDREGIETVYATTHAIFRMLIQMYIKLRGSIITMSLRIFCHQTVAGPYMKTDMFFRITCDHYIQM